MRQTINKGRTNFSPNSLRGGHPLPVPKEKGGYRHYMEKVEGKKIRERRNSFKDFFSQAKLFYDSMSDTEKKHILEAFHFELGKVEVMEVRQRMVYMMANVDRELARDIAKGIGVDPPEDEKMVREVARDARPRVTGRKSIDGPGIMVRRTKSFPGPPAGIVMHLSAPQSPEHEASDYRR
jgi:hypothetical protein